MLTAAAAIATANSSEKGARHDAIVEREGKGGDGSALCRPPAPPALVDDADWCVCFEGLICEGSDCDVDMWDPKEIQGKGGKIQAQ